MPPIKFEENIKKELENRIIPVSSKAWDSLSERLGASKPNRKSYWWLGVAASFMIAVLIMYQFSKNATEVTPTVVTAPIIEETLPNENNRNELKQSEILIVQEETKPMLFSEDNNTIDDVEVKREQEVRLISSIELPLSEIDANSFENQKVLEVVAQIVELKEENNVVTDAEIENLLMEAQNEIEVQKLLNDTSATRSVQTVNADLLLYEVESEINKSFRDKVFKELKIQFKSIKTAVAQRNN